MSKWANGQMSNGQMSEWANEQPATYNLQPATYNLKSTLPLSQGKLQDYVDCPRRFELRYVLMQPWPALITAEPDRLERQMQRGADFHRLAHRHALGIAPAQLEATIHDPDLARWWRNFLRRPPDHLPETVRRAEVVVTAPLAGFRLLAKFDLLAVEPGERFVIVDWKTSRRRPPRGALARRLQTRLYRFLAVEAGAEFNGGQRPAPEQVEMIYWFAAHGGAAERFPYDAQQHAADAAYLTDLLTEIAARRQPGWPLTPDERRCRFCNYRSLCQRGVRPGFLADLEDDIEPEEIEIDLEQIAEIEF